MEDIININESLSFDEAIERYEYHEYVPVTGSSVLTTGGEIRIVIETQDLMTHPSESYLLVEGQLTKNDDTVFANADKIALTNNGIMHLFTWIKYGLSGQEIEYMNHVGQATTMIGLLKYPDDFSRSKGLNQLWQKDTTDDTTNNTGFNVRQGYIIKSPAPKGTFSFCIPLKHIFGFMDDYTKILYGFKQELTLYRSHDNDAIFKDAAVAAGKIRIDRLSWFVPHVTMSDTPRFKFYKQIQDKIKYQVGYRRRQCETFTVPQSTSFTWRLSVKTSPEKPRWVIVGFQNDRSGDQDKNPSLFDHVNVKDIHVTMNAHRYPEVNYNLSFSKQQFSRAYNDAATFRAKYYNTDELVGNPNINPDDYKNLYPLFVFDVSKQSETMKNSVVDIQIKAVFDQNPSVNTEAYAVVISDKIISFESDGNRLNVIQS